MSTITDRWTDPEIGLSQTQMKRVEGFRVWLRKRDSRLARELADPPLAGHQAEYKPNDMRNLEKSILLGSTSISAAHTDCQILSKFVAYLNRTAGATIPTPRISTLFTLPRNPFSGDVVDAVNRIQGWIRVEQNWIVDQGSAPPLELTVLSAILHGGLLHKSTVVALARALLEPSEKVGHIAGQLFVTLNLPWNGVPDMEFRTWQPDEQTACAIWPSMGDPAFSDASSMKDDQLGRLLFQRIAHGMRHYGLPKPVRPQSLKHLIDTVELAARTEVPSVLVDYATREIVSHSIRPEVRRRIFRQAPLQDDTNAAAPMPEETSEFLSSSERENPDDLEPTGLQNLRAALRVSSAPQAVAQLASLLKGVKEKDSVWYLISEFALYLLTRRQSVRPGHFVRHNLALSTVKAYAINSVGRRFGRLVEGAGLSEFDADSFEDYYAQAIENALGERATLRQKRSLTSALREFHDFLVSEHGAPQIHDSDIFGSDRGLLPVDATIVTLEEYNQTRQIIRSDLLATPDARVRQIAEAMLILGFKCGTRRMEARNLQIADLLVKGEPWLIIRPWGEHKLKTINATRQLPLGCLLSEEEQSVLKACLQDARTVSAENPYLFGISNSECGYRAIPEDVVMPIILRALRQATGDRRIRYHHCRHSFATWTFLRLMLSDLPAIPNLFPHLVETTAWLQEAKSFRRKLYGGDQPTRKHARAVASLLGHSGPKISCEHYIHCLDWLMPHLFASSSLLGANNAEAIAKLSGISQSTVYLRKQRADNSIPVTVFQKRFPNVPPRYQTLTPNTTVPAGGEALEPSILDHWSFLFLCDTTNDSQYDIAERFGLDASQADTVMERVRALQGIEEERGNKVKRHRHSFAQDDRDLHGKGSAKMCPIRPTSDTADKFMRRLEPLLMEGIKRVPEWARLAITYYVNNIWSTENVLPFRDPAEPEDAITYVAFLTALGFGGILPPISFVSFDRSARSATRAAWIAALRISDEKRPNLEQADPPFGISEASKRWLWIRPRLDSTETDVFRFLMVMAAIAYGFL